MVTPVGPRVSKEEFMHALGLDSRNPEHEPLYRALREEAIIVYNEMNRDNSDLLDNLRNDPENGQPPFFWHHIRQERQQWGIMEIWRNAGPRTRPYFELGATNGEYGPNWVTGWLLYSVFRSRDSRNDRSRKKGDDGGNNPGRGGGSAGQGQPKSPKSRGTGTKSTYYDPVRNGAH
ncbi:hypothetical protein FQN57_000736 [Myotisia sp. PD_48]|nr:hypothetical protein FQN57_000736 [Myotisia sp. PD_48]